MTGTINPLPHRQAAELLPWLINGTLAPDEQAAVRAHARTCVRCRRDLEQLTRVQRALVEHGDALDTAPTAQSTHRRPPPQSLAVRLIGDATDVASVTAPADRARAPTLGRLRAALQSLIARPAPVLLVAQALMLIILATLLGTLLLTPRDDAAYVTLTEPDTLPAGRYIRIVIDPQSSDASIRQISLEHGLTVAAGPTGRGVYTLHAQGVDNGRFAALVDAIGNEPGVLFAQGFTVGARP